MLRTLALALAMLLPVADAGAEPIVFSFTASGFEDTLATLVPPTDPVSGTIAYDAEPVTGAILSLSALDLTIDDHVYSLDELSFVNLEGDTAVIGAGRGYSGPSPEPAPEANVLVVGTDDFEFRFDRVNLAPLRFIYVSRGDFASWQTLAPGIEITRGDVPPVPEPAAPWLLGWVLAALGCRRRPESPPKRAD